MEKLEPNDITLKERVIQTRKQINRETLDLPNQIRADIMNSAVLATSFVMAKDRASNEIYVNVGFIGGTSRTWKYKVRIQDFRAVYDRINLYTDDIFINR